MLKAVFRLLFVYFFEGLWALFISRSPELPTGLLKAVFMFFLIFSLGDSGLSSFSRSPELPTGLLKFFVALKNGPWNLL